MSRRLRWIPVGLLLVAALLRFWELGAQSLWYDEAYGWWVATEIPLEKALRLSVREVIPPLTYLLWRGWAAVAGTTEFAMRAPSALLGVLAVAAAGRTARRLSGQRAAVAAVALFAAAPPLLWAARELRMYGPLLAFTLAADAALLEVLWGPPRHRRRWAWLWGGAALAALYTLVLAGFWLAGQGLFAAAVLALQARRGGRERQNAGAAVRALLPPALIAAGLYLPWLLAAAGSLGRNSGYWAGHLPPSAFFATALRGITTVKFLEEVPGVRWGAAITAIAALSLLLVRRLRARLYPLVYAVPSLLALCLIYADMPKWGPRHAVLFAPAPFMALALGWGGARTIRAEGRRRAATALLALGTATAALPLLTADANVLANPAFARDDWRAVAAYVEEHRAPGDVVILETGSIFPAWTYYAGDEGLLPLPDDELLDVNHVLTYEKTAPILNERLRGAANVWVVTWIPEVTDPTAIVPALLAEVGHEAPVPAFHGVGLRRFVLDGPPALPARPGFSARYDAELLPELWLRGVNLPEEQRADEPLRFRMWWTTGDPGAHEGRFYQVSFRLHDAAGRSWLRRDEPPGRGDYRPERWPSGTLVLGQIEAQLPPGIPPGSYAASLTLYDGAASDSLELGEIAITRPAAPPAVPGDMAPAVRAASGSGSGSAPLALLAVGLDAPAAAPCEKFSGRLFWEVREAAPAPLAARVALGDASAPVPLEVNFAREAWRPGDRFLTPFALEIPCRGTDLSAPLQVTLGGEAGEMARWRGPEAAIVSGRIYALPEGPEPLDVQAGEELARLAGYRLAPTPVRASEPFSLTLYWEVQNIIDVPYTVFVHVTPAGTHTIAAQEDTWPGRGRRATFTWVPGEIVVDAHALPGLPPGRYDLRVGLYDPEGARLPLSRGGEALPDAAFYVLRDLEVR